MKRIESRSNPTIKELLSLKKRASNGAMLIEGAFLLETALQSEGVSLNHLLMTKAFIEGNRALSESFAKKGGTSILVSEGIISLLSETSTPQGVIASITYKIKGLSDLILSNTPLLIISDGISDPGNLGSLIRSSEALGADALIALPGGCEVFSQKVIRASAGSLFHIPIIHASHEEATRYMTKNSIPMVVTEARASKPIWSVDLTCPVAIVLGSEAHGVSEKLKTCANERVAVPMSGSSESLNAAVAGSIILYEALSQRTNKKTPRVQG